MKINKEKGLTTYDGSASEDPGYSVLCETESTMPQGFLYLDAELIRQHQGRDAAFIFNVLDLLESATMDIESLDLRRRWVSMLRAAADRIER